MNPWLLLLIGLALGAIVAWLATRAYLQSSSGAQLRQSESRAAAAAATAAAARERYQIAEQRANALSERLESEQKGKAAADASLEAERKSLQQQRKLLEDAENELTKTFKSLAGDVLKDQSQAFLRLAGERFNTLAETSKSDLEAREKAIAALLGPLNQSLKGYDEQVQEMEKARREAYGGLQNELGNLILTNDKLQKATGNLTVALKGGSQVRGRWGQMTLRRVVEMAGMVEHCDFTEEETLFGDSGRLRPDMIVNLPGGPRIAVDAKVPQAFLDAAFANTEEEQQELLSRSGRLVRDRMNELADREYWKHVSPGLAMAVMFLPAEAYLPLALRQDPMLLEDGIEKNVLLVTPTTLIALLRAVAYGWRQEEFARNAQAVRNLGQQMHDRLKIFLEHFAETGSALRRAVENYNKAAGSLESRVLISARRFKELSAVAGEELGAAEVIDEVPRTLNLPEPNGGAPTLAAPSKQAPPDEALENPKLLP